MTILQQVIAAAKAKDYKKLEDLAYDYGKQGTDDKYYHRWEVRSTGQGIIELLAERIKLQADKAKVLENYGEQVYYWYESERVNCGSCQSCLAYGYHYQGLKWEDSTWLGWGDVRHQESYSKEDGEVAVLLPSLMQYGDYGGDNISRANYKWMAEHMKDHPAVRTVSGGYGSCGIAINIDLIDEEILDILRGLDNYPVIDEGSMYESDEEIFQEGWEGWLESDYRRAVEERFEDDEDIEEDVLAEVMAVLNAYTSDEWLALWHEQCNEFGIIVEYEDAVNFHLYCQGSEGHGLRGSDDVISFMAGKLQVSDFWERYDYTNQLELPLQP